MKFAIVLFALVAVALARPDTILDLDLDDFHHGQDVSNEQIQGTYRWTSPEGEEFFVSYIADSDGYRVIDSNAVPVDNGARADGNQGSFVSIEDDDDDDDDRK